MRGRWLPRMAAIRARRRRAGAAAAAGRPHHCSCVRHPRRPRPRSSSARRLISPRCVRWSVTGNTGGAWFPAGVLPKWDYHHRPFFHGHDLSLTVPAEPLQVVCTRGLEYERSERLVSPVAGGSLTVECDPVRLFDPGGGGWYGGDLHVHMNYSGDLVCTPADAARMQLGEGLHLVNLVAANCLTSLVFDRDMLEQFCGADLPWSSSQVVAGWGSSTVTTSSVTCTR